MFNKVKVIVSGVFACASLHMYAGLFDSVSDLTGGIIKIEERKSEEVPTAPLEEKSKSGRKHSKKTARASEHERQKAAQDAEAEKDRGDILYREFNISDKTKTIDKLTSIAISLGAERVQGQQL